MTIVGDETGGAVGLGSISIVGEGGSAVFVGGMRVAASSAVGGGDVVATPP
jgi:hypothetical protein